MLPADLAIKFAKHSPRPGISSLSDECIEFCKAEELLYRSGRGVSYHEFELALMDGWQQSIVANGFEEEMLKWFPVEEEEQMLQKYFKAKVTSVNIGFSRSVINLILRKLPAPH